MKRFWIVCLSAGLVAGCQTSTPTSSAPARQRMTFDAGRWQESVTGPAGTAEGDFQQAMALYRSEQYAASRKAFYGMRDKYGETFYREDALFYEAESYYHEKRYDQAYYTYEQLLKDYPGSRYLDRVMAREFDIANRFLKGQRRETFGMRLFTDTGFGLEVLEKVREHDVNGPYADRGLAYGGAFQYRQTEFDEASFLYDLLIEHYPKSRYQPQAHLVGSESRRRAYQGALYDGSRLTQAKGLLEAAQRQFPEVTKRKVDAPRILDWIRVQQAERDYQVAEYYRRVGQHRAADHYYQQVIKSYPDTAWARRAKQRQGASP